MPDCTLQCKAQRGGSLSVWLNEMHEQQYRAENCFGVVVHKRIGYGRPEDQYVTMTLATFRLLYGQLLADTGGLW